jgi:opacity protein-like surface antigen
MAAMRCSTCVGRHGRPAQGFRRGIMQRGIAVLLAGALGSGGALAETPSNELTVFGGYRVGGSFDVRDAAASYELEDGASFGLIFNRSYDASTQWEVIYARQDTAAEVDDPGIVDGSRVSFDSQLLELGGTYVRAGGKVRPYLAATIGGTHVRTRARTPESDTFLSGSLGVGVRIAPDSRLGMRLEARYHAILTDKDTDLFCQTGPEVSACAIRVEGSILGQVAIFAGISFRF